MGTTAPQKKYSESVEMYLETIYNLTEEGGKAKTTEIARDWAVTPASATEMVQKLAKMGLVEYTPYHGTRLTDGGIRLARSIIRKHRLLELFLTTEVAMPATEGHDRACELEHVIPDAFERWVCTFMGHPRKGAKGETIPRGACCPAPG